MVILANHYRQKLICVSPLMCNSIQTYNITIIINSKIYATTDLIWDLQNSESVW